MVGVLVDILTMFPGVGVSAEEEEPRYDRRPLLSDETCSRLAI